MTPAHGDAPNQVERNGNNMESILASIKKLLGISDEYMHFDADIIMHINTALSTLTQIGVGPQNGFSISNDDAKWSDFIESSKLDMVKSYIHLKVKLLFDPPLSSAVIESTNRLITELEWRISVAVSQKENNVEGGSE